MTPVNTIAGRASSGFANAERRVEIGDIDPVADMMDAGGGFGSQAREQLRLGSRHEQNRVGACRGPAFKRQQRAALAPVDRARRPGAGLGILPPFLEIDIDHVENRPARLGDRKRTEPSPSKRHRRGRDRAPRRVASTAVTQPAVAEIELRQRGAVSTGRQGCAAWRGAATASATRRWRKSLSRCSDTRHIFGRVDKGREMDPIPLGEVPQHVPCPDLVALVGRIGDPVRKKQNILHASGHDTACQPRPRTIGGPSRAATASGSFFQSFTNRANFGLSGFRSGTFCPAASLN